MGRTFYNIAFFVSVLVMSLVTYYAYEAFRDYDNDAVWVSHTERVKAEVMSMVSVSKSLSMTLRRRAIREDSVIELNFEAAALEVEQRYKLVDSLVADNPVQLHHLDSLKTMMDQHFLQCKAILEYATSEVREIGSLISLLAIEGHAIDSIGLLRNEIIREESKLLKNRSAERERSARLAPITLLVLALMSLILISYLFINTFKLLDKNELASKALQLKVFELGNEIDKNADLHRLLRGVINSSTNGIQAFEAIRDQENQIVDFRAILVNITAAELVQVSEADQMKSTLLTITPGNKEAGLFDKYVDVVRNQQTMHHVQYYEHENFEMWFDITAVPHGDGFVVTFANITETKKIHRKLERQKQELESANQELERFAYVASHDLQEPLRKIRTFGDRLSDRYSDALEERGRDYIVRMRSAAERMQILINDLLKFSRISRKEMPLVSIDLTACLDRVLETLELEISEKKAVVNSVQLPEIMGDASQIEQLFQNLLTNSFKYTRPEATPVVNISCSKELNINELTDAEYLWRIDFEDNGIGFDNQYKNQIFEVFERLHGRTEYQGTGIGLALCDKIVSRHNGKIEAHGEIGKGAIFSIFLPA